MSNNFHPIRRMNFPAICSAITSYTQTIKKPPEGGFFNRRL